MKETLPIKFFAKREEDKQRVEGGGGKELPKWVLHGEELYEKSVALSRVIKDVLEEENWNERDIPVIIEVKLNRDAHAKSHRRKIENIFFTIRVTFITEKSNFLQKKENFQAINSQKFS